MATKTAYRFGLSPGGDKDERRPLRAGDVVLIMRCPNRTVVNFFSETGFNMSVDGPIDDMNSGVFDFNAAIHHELLQMLCVVTGLGFEPLGGDKFRLVDAEERSGSCM